MNQGLVFFYQRSLKCYLIHTSLIAKCRAVYATNPYSKITASFHLILASACKWDAPCIQLTPMSNYSFRFYFTVPWGNFVSTVLWIYKCHYNGHNLNRTSVQQGLTTSEKKQHSITNTAMGQMDITHVQTVKFSNMASKQTYSAWPAVWDQNHCGESPFPTVFKQAYTWVSCSCVQRLEGRGKGWMDEWGPVLSLMLCLVGYGKMGAILMHISLTLLVIDSMFKKPVEQ